MNDDHREDPLPWGQPWPTYGTAPSDEKRDEQQADPSAEAAPSEERPADEQPSSDTPPPALAPSAWPPYAYKPPADPFGEGLPVVEGEATPEPDAGPSTELEPVVNAEVVERGLRPDPRLRAPDPAGTQPKWDPESVLPRREREGTLLALASGISSEADATSDADDDGEDLLPAPGGAGGVGIPIATPVVSTPYTARFQFIKGALGALGVVGIAVLVLALTGGSSSVSGPNWSSWKPADNGVDAAVQIAQHVAREYKLDNGKPIVNVRGGPPAYEGQPLVLALLQSGKQPAELSSNSVLYQLCGTGTNCSIAGGTASAQRGLLLRREALELALYTFHYLNVDDVVVTFPPSPQAAAASGSSSSGALQSTTSGGPQHAFLFRQSTLAPELSRTLTSVLPLPAPTVDTMNSSFNADLVDNVTSKALYDTSIVQGQSTLVLVLEPPGVGG